MIGMDLVRRIDNVRERALKLGFEFTEDRHGSQNFIVLRPAQTEAFTVPALVIYRRDAEIFRGDLDAVEHFLNGITWARQYDDYLSLSNDKKRVGAEQRYHAMMLRRQEREEQKRILEILKTKDLNKA